MEAEQEKNVRVEEYSQVLKRRRKDRGITIYELSARTGISQEQLAGVEIGLFELSEPQKKKIAKFLRRQRII